MNPLTYKELIQLEWRQATYYYKPIEDWLISENGILRNMKTGEIRYGRDNVKGKDLHQRVSINHKLYYIHKIVAEAFVENDRPKEYKIVRHLDDNPLHNHYTNLKWGTSQQNTLDAMRNGKIVYDENRRYTRGELHAGALLTDRDVEQIVVLLNNSVPIREISEMFNVHDGIIRHIYIGNSWRHITEAYLPFPKQELRYKPMDKNIKEKINVYIFYNPDAKPNEIIKNLGLENNNTIRSYIGTVKRKYKKE